MGIPAGSIFTGYDLYLVGNASNPPGGSPDYSFANNVNEQNAGIVWTRRYPLDGATRTITYQPFPVEATGFEFNGEQLPRPKLRIANVDQMVGGIVRGNDDLVGAKVCRWRTFAKYLDASNYLAGVSEADPTAYFPPDVFYIERKIVETKEILEFELVSAMDLQGIKLPKRQVMANMCPFKYRGAECGYTGAAHPIPGSIKPDGSAVTDGCDKGLSTDHGCKAHWGTTVALPFGGFPAAGNRRGG